MAWLQKRPQVSAAVQLYTVGLSKNILIVGLGNIGAEYDNTRHNVGFACVDNFVKKDDSMSEWILKKDLKCQLSSGQLGDNRVIVIKPTTFMNLSGEAVQEVMHFYKIPIDNVVVVHDELDIDFGHIRMRRGGSSAGHNGLKSIIGILGEDFGRIRIGIGPKKPARIDGAKFVLQTFTDDEMGQMPHLIQEVNAVFSEYIYGGQLLEETRNFIV